MDPGSVMELRYVRVCGEIEEADMAFAGIYTKFRSLEMLSRRLRWVEMALLAVSRV